MRKIGQILKNADIVDKFKCANMGGMRYSKSTNTLVIVSDHTKGIYHDRWEGDVLHYTGMGKNGDQDVNRGQNATLAASGDNKVDVHLFEVMEAGMYIYRGRVELVDKPYPDIQLGENGVSGKVWMFPIWPEGIHGLDCPIVVFGGGYVRQNGKWIARGSRYDYDVKTHNYEDADTIVENNFGVLLTRARKEMIILIPNDNILDETYTYFADMGMDVL